MELTVPLAVGLTNAASRLRDPLAPVSPFAAIALICSIQWVGPQQARTCSEARHPASAPTASLPRGCRSRRGCAGMAPRRQRASWLCGWRCMRFGDDGGGARRSLRCVPTPDPAHIQHLLAKRTASLAPNQCHAWITASNSAPLYARVSRGCLDLICKQVSRTSRAIVLASWSVSRIAGYGWLYSVRHAQALPSFFRMLRGYKLSLG